MPPSSLQVLPMNLLAYLSGNYSSLCAMGSVLRTLTFEFKNLCSCNMQFITCSAEISVQPAVYSLQFAACSVPSLAISMQCVSISMQCVVHSVELCICAL